MQLGAQSRTIPSQILNRSNAKLTQGGGDDDRHSLGIMNA